MLALVTATSAHPHDKDLAPLVAAFERLGTKVTVVSWDDPAVEWPRFDAVIVRSTWDYAERLDEFLTWLDATAMVDERALGGACLDRVPSAMGGPSAMSGRSAMGGTANSVG